MFSKFFSVLKGFIFKVSVVFVLVFKNLSEMFIGFTRSCRFFKRVVSFFVQKNISKVKEEVTMERRVQIEGLHMRFSMRYLFNWREYQGGVFEGGVVNVEEEEERLQKERCCKRRRCCERRECGKWRVL